MSARILIVDDTQDNIDIAFAMLSKSGFSRIVTASGGVEAVQILQKSIRDDVSDIRNIVGLSSDNTV